MNRDLSPRFRELVCSATEASSMEVVEVIQELWSGYGRILRIGLSGGTTSSVIAKHIEMDSTARHPRGWNSIPSHQRKLKSYRVETAWYRDWSERCRPSSRVPRLLGSSEENDDIFLLLEDLDTAGFPSRLTSATPIPLHACLDWLANFHASFLGCEPTGLWETGTYWHLATRAEELAQLTDSPLKEAAPALDERLAAARFQTIVHGDAKLANFCFSPAGDRVAAVDFQYVGGGCGMKDLAYFIGSSVEESALDAKEQELLSHYFNSLRGALSQHHPEVDPDEVEAEWRALFPIAWTDFHRFLCGWSPGHWKINSYGKRLAREVIDEL